jgi:hypothetical protein
MQEKKQTISRREGDAEDYVVAEKDIEDLNDSEEVLRVGVV